MTAKYILALLSAAHAGIGLIGLLGTQALIRTLAMAVNVIQDPSSVTAEIDVGPTWAQMFVFASSSFVAFNTVGVIVASLALSILVGLRIRYATAKLIATGMCFFVPLGTVPGLITLLAFTRPDVQFAFSAKTNRRKPGEKKSEQF